MVDANQHLIAAVIDLFRSLLDIISVAIDIIKFWGRNSQIPIIKPDGRRRIELAAGRSKREQQFILRDVLIDFHG